MIKTREKFHYQCINCGKIYSASEIRYLCQDCATETRAEKPPRGVLKVIYPYEEIKNKNLDFNMLNSKGFLDLLPIRSLESLPSLKVGDTPLYRIKKLDNKPLLVELFIKDDSQNPTYSFKDRASALVSAYAKEQGVETIIAASTGNAGSSLAGICAAQNQKAIIVVPEKAPIAKLTQILMYGAKIVPVKGTYDDAFDLSIEATKEFGWYNRNTAYNPLTVEGKRSVAFEIIHELGGLIPDRIFIPVGDGVILSGVYKGFEDLLNLGFIDRMPVLVAVQSEGSNNLIRNVSSDDFKIKQSNTVADSISVDVPRNFYMAQQFIQKYDGEVLSVSDEAILEASRRLSLNTGLFAEPAAAAAFAGFLEYLDNERLISGTVNIVLSTGSGLKDLQAVQKMISLPDAIEPSLTKLKKLIF